MEESLGSIIAFEGHQDVVSTQLRLLPTSSQILLLPNIESYLSSETQEHKLEPHAYIRKLHDAAKSRNDAAQDFLQGSTPSNKRLVFVHGGTSYAHMLCIKAIMQHETNGDAVKAEFIFKDLIQGGLAGLEARGKTHKRLTGMSFFDDPEDSSSTEDPVSRAMRAAEALDRLTESLQPSNDLDLTIESRPRSSSLPLYGYSDGLRDSAPFFVFGAQDQVDSHQFLDEPCEDSTSPAASRRTVSEYEQLFQLYENPSGFSQLPSSSPQSPASCIGDAYLCSSEDPSSPLLNTPWSDVYSPFSPRCSQIVTYGEASVIDMRGSSRKVVRRVRSLDRVYAASPRYRDASLPLEGPESTGNKTPRCRPSSCMVEPNIRDSWNHESKCIDGPRTIFVKPKRPTISIAPISHESLPESSHFSDTTSDSTASAGNTPTPIVEQVLPFTEHLVIYFKQDDTDVLLETVIESFKAGGHPGSQSLGLGDTDVAEQSLPQTPQSSHTFQSNRLSVVSEEASITTPSTDEYDPFAYTHPAWPQTKSPSKARAINVERPPTPARTPTPSMVNQRECFHDFHIAAQQTAVATQNTLRSILNVYYPPESQNYRQFQFLLPELEGLWNPTVREAEPESPRRSRRNLDQIVAIGAQSGVGRGFTSRITRQLEKLGTKQHGLSRTGKLDFRYLLANAMQAFTAQPLTNQTCDNPFNNPYLLATLIVPHFEAYLGLHPDSRYLILEYPPEHLATILALQKLVGVDVMKVAQIANTKNNEQLPFTHIRGASVGKNAEDLSILRVHKRSPSSSPKLPSSEVTFDKANFLLSSTASDAEIDTFVATILDILTDVSSFYKLEEPPLEPTISSSSTPSVRPAFSSYSRSPSPYTRPVTSASVGTPPQSLSPISLRRSSLGETIYSAKTYNKAPRRRQRDSQATDYMSAYTLDLKVDHDLHMEERRLMPMYMHRPTPSDGSSRKAMKFLGLA